MNNKLNSLSTGRDVTYPTQCSNPANTSYHNLKNWLETKHSNPTQTSLHLLTPDTTSDIPTLQQISHKPLSLGAPSAFSIPLLCTQVILMEELLLPFEIFALTTCPKTFSFSAFLTPSPATTLPFSKHFPQGNTSRSALETVISPRLPVSADLA